LEGFVKNPVFFSYARADSAFALHLAADLKAKGANVWLDQLDIRPGRQWDREIERALTACDEMLVILSPAAVESNNVMDEIGFALDEGKTVIPVLQEECRRPFRLRRLQYIDFKADYEKGLAALLTALAVEKQIISADIGTDTATSVDRSERTPDQQDEAKQDRPESKKAETVDQGPVKREETQDEPKRAFDRPATSVPSDSEARPALSRGKRGRPQSSKSREHGLATHGSVDLKGSSIENLRQIAEDVGVPSRAGLRKQELIFKILQAQAEKSGLIFSEGLLECEPDGFGFLRAPEFNYLPGPDDVYVSPSQIRRFNLRTGDTISGQIRPPKEGERYFALIKVDAINFEPPEEARNKTFFENLTPLHPNERLKLETVKDNYSGRVMDLLTPIGKGQRGLIVSPPRTGKTMLLQSIANSITANHPDVTLVVLLIDGCPEEVTEMLNSVRCEVISSTTGEPKSRHVKIAELVLEEAKRIVESRRESVILLDSITRLARAYGEDSNAALCTRRFLEAARKTEEGGSLTIVATAASNTGNRMDDTILEELKGVSNMEIYLDREVFDKGVFPAIDIRMSSTRKHELLLSKEELQSITILRKALKPLSTVESIELLLDKLSKTRSNVEFLQTMRT
jgi:transcription termination factor Rho